MVNWSSQIDNQHCNAVFKRTLVLTVFTHKILIQESRKTRYAIWTNPRDDSDLHIRPDATPWSCHCTCFVTHAYQMLTSLEMPIFEKHCALSHYFVRWPILKFYTLYCTAKVFQYTKTMCYRKINIKIDEHPAS
jgi:hypothetical protein